MLNNFIRVLPQYLVPQHGLSRFAGWVSRCRVPWIKNWIVDRFIQRYQVDMSIAAQPDPHQYANFNSFFTRALRADARTIDPNTSVIISPVDGAISQVGNIEQNKLIQAKGFNYGVQQLVGGSKENAALFEGGKFITIYLAPKDYHRVHIPFAGRLTKMIFVPGKLFSVNPLTTSTVSDLFARNERVVMLFETTIGPMAVIMVGAMLVASISIAWEGIIAPAQGNAIKEWDYSQENKQFAKGAELGHFELGSTVILLFGANAINWVNSLHEEQAVQLGQKLGEMNKTT